MGGRPSLSLIVIMHVRRHAPATPPEWSVGGWVLEGGRVR